MKIGCDVDLQTDKRDSTLEFQKLQEKLVSEYKLRARSLRTFGGVILVLAVGFAWLAGENSDSSYLWVRVITRFGFVALIVTLIQVADHWGKISKIQKQLNELGRQNSQTEETQTGESAQECHHPSWRVTKYDPETRKTVRSCDICGESLSAAQAVRAVRTDLREK